MKQISFFLLCLIYLTGKGQLPCENGLADGLYPCNQITLLAHMSPEEVLAVEHNGYFLNDIWGWTDTETNREYALVGLKDGVSFVDITVPTQPVLLGKLPETNSSGSRISDSQDINHEKSTWRDIKTYDNHAFIVSDLNGAHGLQVFDLTKLRGLDGSDVKTFTKDAHHTGFGSAHNIVINEATGYAYTVGIYRNEGICRSGLYMMDISDPKNPVFAGCFDEDGYTHDAQCVIYQGPDNDYQGKEICFNSNEDTFTVVNVEDKANPTMISRTGYDNSRYSHQGWLSEDHRFFLMNDELDEKQYGHTPRTLIWDIHDLDNPVLIGDYYNNEPAIDHNLYTRNNMVYESNYLSGLRVLSMDSIASGTLRERAFFDTYPQSNETSFGGNWSNYPYFESGTIIVSDMNNGLFLVKLNLEDDPFTKHPSDWMGCVNGNATFEVAATGEDLFYQWQIFDGRNYVSLSNNNDYAGVQTPTLSVKASFKTSQYTYRCVILNNNGSRFDSYQAELNLLEASQPPIASFTWENLGDGTFQFINSSEHAASYFWDFGNSENSSEENPTKTFDTGSFEVSLVASNECGADTVVQSIANYILRALPINSFKLYPNPASKLVHVVAAPGSLLSITDMSGKKIFSSSINEAQQSINLSIFIPGIYHVLVQTNSGTAVKRKLIVR